MTSDHCSMPVTVTAATRIGWIGTGVMGSAMCGHVLSGGFPVTVHNRTRSKARALLDAGAIWSDSAASVAERSDVIFTIVGFPPDVREVYFGGRGLLAAARPGHLFVDMTTTEPSLAREIHGRARNVGAFAIDAPVSGGDVGAKRATLSIMAGGDRIAVEAALPLLERMGRSVCYLGAPGAGQHTKMCNQIVIASTMVGVCESLLYGYKAGLDLETMLGAIRGGAAGCWSLDNYAPRLLRRDFAPGFLVDHFVKDMGIALLEAERMNLSLPGLSLAHQLYHSVQAHGHGRCGTQALLLALEQMANVRIDAADR